MDNNIRPCGECSMCCKLMAVSELQKPAGVWCDHCRPGFGCGIHGMVLLPESCAKFQCLWTQTPEMPEELRPDRSHAILYAHDEMLHVIVPAGYKHVLESNRMLNGILQLIHRRLDIVCLCGNERNMVPRAGATTIKETL